MQMKRLFMISLAACLGVLSLAAQEVVADTVATEIVNGVETHDIRGVVLDSKGRPIVGAQVSVTNYNAEKSRTFLKLAREEISVSTITDIDGKFLLEDVPVTAKYILVESVGMEPRAQKIDVPLSIETRRKKLTFVVQAGVSMSRYTGYGGDFKVGYEVGLGLEVRTSKHWAFRPMVQISNRGTVYQRSESGLDYKETWNPTFLDIPLYFVNRQKLARNVNLAFSFGPAVGFGLGGKVTADFNGEQTEYDAFGNTITNGEYKDGDGLLYFINFGLAYSLGVEYKQLTVGVWGKNMFLPTGGKCISMDPCEHNWVLTFGAAYRF